MWCATNWLGGNQYCMPQCSTHTRQIIFRSVNQTELIYQSDRQAFIRRLHDFKDAILWSQTKQARSSNCLHGFCANGTTLCMWNVYKRVHVLTLSTRVKDNTIN